MHLVRILFLMFILAIANNKFALSVICNKSNILNTQSHYSFSDKPLIPKIIHQIWLGNAPLPKLHQALMETWKKHHPDWTYKLWTEEDVRNWQGTFYLQDLYNKAYTAQEKADILRFNIVYRYGGLYVDTDTECLKSFDWLHHKYKFYAPYRLEISMFASEPNNSLFLKIFNEIRRRWDITEKEFFKNNSSIFRKNYLVKIAVARCQGSFVQEVKKYVEQEPLSIILPDNMLDYSMGGQIVFCAKCKLLKFLPSTRNLSKDLCAIANAMSIQRRSIIKVTTVYNDADKKINIQHPVNSAWRKWRNWIHNTIDIHFVGCS